MKVLLVYPPNQLMAIETPRPDGSLGPLYLAGALENNDVEVDILDASVGGPKQDLKDTFYRSVMQENGLTRIGMNEDEITHFISMGEYDVVGISSNFTPQTKMAFEVARAAKRDGCYVVAGGVNARNLAERFLRDGKVDQVVASEGEQTICDIVDCLSFGYDPRAMPGTISLADDGAMMVKAIDYKNSPDLDYLPVPRWNKLPFEKYEKIASPHGVIVDDLRYASIMTSRGCPFQCAYCHISTEKNNFASTGNIGKYRVKSVERVMLEVNMLQDLGVKKLYFEDDSLLAKKQRVKEIFNHLLGRGLKIAGVNGVNLVHFQQRNGTKLEFDREYLELLSNSGFNQIVFPVESASQRILDKYATAKLDHSTLDVVELVKLAVSVGITCPINMMVGFPDETEEEIKSSIDLGRRLVDAGAAYCTFFIPIPFPGSQLYHMALAGGHLDPNFDTDIMNWKQPVLKNTVVAPGRVEELRDFGYEIANTKEHVAERLKQSTGARWKDV